VGGGLPVFLLMDSTRNARGCGARHLKLIRPSRSCGGFTYIGVLLAVVFIGVGLAATGTVWQQTRQREKERELLFVGNQFRQALERYYENPPPGKAKQFPQKLEDLLRDDRHPDVRRYLRKLYPDPMTSGAEWGLLRGTDKAIVGLYSLSDGEPLKTANFDPEDAELVGKRHYHEWRFIAMNGGVAAEAVTARAADNAMGSDAVAQPSSQSDAMPQADAQQNLPAAEPLPPHYETPPGAPRSAVCSAAFVNARASCMAIARKGGMASASDCLRTAGAQYAQCLK
jgi:type II secretory pathway pseudopilin PulG